MTSGPQRAAAARISKEEITQESSPNHASNILDGGARAWLQVLGSVCLFFNCWGIPNSYGVFQTFYETQLLAHKASSSEISWIGSFQAFLLVVTSVLSGPLYDWGYFRPLVVVGSVLIVFGMMVSLCQTYWQLFLAQGFVVGLGSACLLVPAVAILPTYFSSKKALAQGLAASGSSSGGIVYPIMFRQLQPRIGFGWATRVMGFVALVSLLVPLAIMRIRVKPPSRRSLLETAAWKEPPYVLFNIGQFFGVMGTYVPFYYAGLYGVQQLHMSESSSFYLVSILNAGSFCGRILPNAIADPIGPLNVLVPCTVAVCVLAFAWLGITNTAGMIAFCVLYGFFSGTFVSIPPTVIVTLSPSLSTVGTRVGMSFAMAAFGTLIGNPIAGAIVGDGLDWRRWAGLKIWCGACFVLALAFVSAARVAKTGSKIAVRA